jgi:hypothetical protein
VIIFGDGGEGKSYLGLSLALTLQTGIPLVGWYKPLQRLRVAYLDWEWVDHRHRARMRRLLGDDPDPLARELRYVPCQQEGALIHQIDRLRRLLHEARIEYVVIDSVALACAGKPEEAEVALAFFQALSQLEVGACLLAHVNRLGDPLKPFGSAFWHNSARLTWNIQRAAEQESERLRVTVFNRKNNDGPLHDPLGLEFEFGERTLINAVDVAPALQKRRSERASNSLRSRLIELLRGGDGATYEDAAMALDTSPEYVRKVVKEDIGRTFRRFPDSQNGRITRLGLVKEVTQ